MTEPADILADLRDASRCEQTKARLIELLEQQRGLYRRLGQLAERQRGLIALEDSAPLLALLGDRQKLVDGLCSLNARLAPYRRHWTEVYQSLGPESRRRVTELLEEANSALGAILHSDGRDCAALSTRRREMGDQLAAMDAGSRAGAAYRASEREGAYSLTDAEA